jgi:hypothetical protein
MCHHPPSPFKGGRNAWFSVETTALPCLRLIAFCCSLPDCANTPLLSYAPCLKLSFGQSSRGESALNDSFTISKHQLVFGQIPPKQAKNGFAEDSGLKIVDAKKAPL